LNFDAVTPWIPGSANSAVLPGFLGNLDTQGQAAASLKLSGVSLPPAAVGVTLTFAWLGKKGGGFVSNPVAIVLGV
jgi:hypothetical protein